MKVLITGVKGQLGFDMVKECQSRGIETVGVDIEEMDITDAESVRRVISEAKVEAVVHCAAWTAVDAAEEKTQACRKVNADGTRNIAEVCRDLDLKMIYISTDYVFDGEGERPWEPDDERNPLNVYGQTKYEGELAVQENLKKYFIVRISWVFGLNGKNFIKTMLRLGRERGAVSVVNDQFGSPTYTKDLSVLLTDMLESGDGHYGIYHATNEGICSWYEFTKEIFAQAGIEASVTPVPSEQFPTPAKRPHNSRMSKEKLVQNGFSRLPTWQDALKRYLVEIGELSE